MEKQTETELNGAEAQTSESKKDKVVKYIKQMPKKYFITAFSGMAQGLFVTLIAGTILGQIASWIGDNAFGNILLAISKIAKTLMGAGIGVGIAYSFKANKLVTFTAAVTGLVGAFSDKIMAGSFALVLGAPGNPVGAYVVALLTIEIASLYAGKTKLDIILVPLGMMLLSVAGIFVAYPFIWLIGMIGKFIEVATKATPFFMGIIIAVVMGILLTMPTSSAAIWISVAAAVSSDSEAMLLAGGAACVGCAAHMVGFAVASYRENGIGGLISQGLGTSMLQIPNIMKKPIIMLPAIISSAIVGPLSTCVFKLYCNSTGGGMGTSGLVGVFGMIDASTGMGVNGWVIGFGIALLMFILPAAISLLVSELLRKKGLIKFGDMSLDNK